MNIHPQYSGAPWFKTPAEVIEELDEIGCTGLVPGLCPACARLVPG
ncbi:hypothetical protein [Burkholderia gladioli]|nr:hypothetical protein [Burkholderia gladioli]